MGSKTRVTKKKTKYKPLTKEQEKLVGEKMHKMAGEDRPQKQKIAIAISVARESTKPAKKAKKKKSSK